MKIGGKTGIGEASYVEGMVAFHVSGEQNQDTGNSWEGPGGKGISVEGN